VAGPERTEIDDVLDLVVARAREYLKGLDERTLRAADVDERADRFAAALPERGDGAMGAVDRLLREGTDASVASSGPRFFHFVQGGVTPAALGADWVTSLLDQNAGLWVATPLGTGLAGVAVDWLKELFGLPASWEGVLTTGATMANYAALACARRWWGLRRGVDVEADGFSDLPPVPVFSSGYLHASARKALGMLGVGRERVRLLSLDGAGRLDLDGLRDAFRALNGEPAILIGNAGEVNAGHFDPLTEMADLAEEYGAWLHVDGAFGLFAAISPRSRHLVEGVERAHSVISDGHKWLNVAYDCGFAFVRDPDLLPGVFSSSGSAAYLAGPADRRPPLDIGPEMSQRARGIAVWATLAAYGREGYRQVVERHLDLAQRVAGRVDRAQDLERLAEAPLNIVCFRYRPEGIDDEATLNDLNRRLGEAVLRDGRVYVGTTVFDGKTAFRPAIVNWRTREEDVDLLVDVIRELGSKLAAG
jgi:glutamate/tyrosine decarboxylase-like PLP-dependent enzyme